MRFSLSAFGKPLTWYYSQSRIDAEVLDAHAKTSITTAGAGEMHRAVQAA
jgi:hypothetical protein